jgi:hypothetical protein
MTDKSILEAVHDTAQELKRAGSLDASTVREFDAICRHGTGIGSKPRGLEERLSRIAKQCAALPIRDSRHAEELLDYDDQGLPRPSC